MKTVALSQKDHSLTVWELRQEGRASSCLTSAGNVHREWLKFFTSLHTSGNDCRKAPSIDFEVTNKYRWVGKFTSMEFMSNETQLYSGRVKVGVLALGKRGTKAQSASVGVCLSPVFEPFWLVASQCLTSILCVTGKGASSSYSYLQRQEAVFHQSSMGLNGGGLWPSWECEPLPAPIPVA